ncbi:hypothetical protein FRB99_004805 [Tulasnella sp. 403]|nr:hypothetical protein FRB99_004805 [Tulasnella sp. 403]
MQERTIRRGHTIIFSLLAVLAAVEGALSTWLSARFNQHHNYLNTGVRDRSRFLAFTSWFTFLFSLVFIGLFLHSPDSSPVVSVGSHLLFLGLIWIFWTAGAASITSAIGGGYNCSKIDFEVVYCNQLNAEMGFAWAAWVITTLALVAVLIFGIRSARHGEGWRGYLV